MPSSKLDFGGYWTVLEYRNGKLVKKIRKHNLIPTGGRQCLFEKFFDGVAGPTSWYIGLILYDIDGVVTSGDSMTIVSRAWAEYSNYTEAARVAWDFSTVVGAGISSWPESFAEFTFNEDAVIGGAFLCSDNVKDAEDGTLLSCVNFNRTVNNTTVWRVYYTLW